MGEAITERNLQVTTVLRELDGILRHNAAFMDDRGVMVYCTNCESFSAASQRYSDYVGRNMSLQKSRPECVWCHGIYFVSASYDDLGALRMVYPHKAPDVVVQGIENALDAPMISDSRDRTEIFTSWLALSQEEKLRQTRELFRRQDRLARARIRQEAAEEKTEALCARL